MAESNEFESYSLPEERAEKITRQAERTDDFIASLETLVDAQRDALDALREAGDIPDDEKNERLLGIQQTIEELMSRIESEREKNAGREERVARLRGIHDKGLKILASIDADAERAN